MDCIFAVEAVEDPPLLLFEIPGCLNLYTLGSFIELDVGSFAWSDVILSDMYGGFPVESVFEDQPDTLVTSSLGMEEEILEREIGFERAISDGTVDSALSARIENSK